MVGEKLCHFAAEGEGVFFDQPGAGFAALDVQVGMLFLVVKIGTVVHVKADLAFFQEFEKAATALHKVVLDHFKAIGYIYLIAHHVAFDIFELEFGVLIFLIFFEIQIIVVAADQSIQGVALIFDEVARGVLLGEGAGSCTQQQKEDYQLKRFHAANITKFWGDWEFPFESACLFISLQE